MKLHVIYRSTGKENTKARPYFYTKLLCLLSLLFAIQASDARPEVLFLNDDPIPEKRLRLMRATGEVVSVPPVTRGWMASGLAHQTAGSVGLTRSYLAALKLAHGHGWPDDDVVYFVEDDYMHQVDALSCLMDAARALPEAAYLSLHGSIDWRRTVPFDCGSHSWYLAESTTSTFAARIGALHADRWIHRLSLFAGGTADRDICQAYRGVRPFRWSYLIGDLLGNAPGPRGSVAGRGKRAGLQTAMNALAIKSAFRRHELLCADPPLATHLEIPYLAPGVDWEALAGETLAWARERDFPLPAPREAHLA
jgi:hypothetical protein